MPIIFDSSLEVQIESKWHLYFEYNVFHVKHANTIKILRKDLTFAI